MKTTEEHAADYDAQRMREEHRSKQAHEDLVETIAYRERLGGLTRDMERTDTFNATANALNEANLAFRRGGFEERTVLALESIASSLRRLVEKS